MKVKLICRPENYDDLKQKLEESNFIITEDAEYHFVEKDQVNKKTLLGKSDENFNIIPFESIVYIESFDHEIVCHSTDGSYNLKEKLYELEVRLYDYGFVRINKSTIINYKMIKSIKPLFNRKFMIILNNLKRVDVTRSYYDSFKRFIGM